MAKEMIKTAKESGAGLVKFQLFNAEDDKGKPHYDWVKEHELTFEQAKELFDYGTSIGQEVFFSVFAPEYVDWCEKIGVKRYKIAGETEDENILIEIEKTGKPVIISNRGNFDRLFSLQDNIVSWLYCPDGYPTDINCLNLPYYFTEFEPYDGFSDHTIGLDASKIALARGARIIEKHFCLEHNPNYPDNDWSMTPDELKELVRWNAVCQEVLG